ncbi:MAG: hypothetical protein QF486_05535 [Candidatus Woesearchaeota archaeon]|jgi:hypothetical protein|nr:hypothetical protein [Candidatus Woesearchaeota archaeon]MDP7182191.1 hypothetical protein [Candidatus Woesearchaeota archaeon]MDP7199050.1 hypothetical protein [Candidatus Woesearchaeota archaeon]MDP7467760.1 hypothetical protein [Candidatus Woesearchaeota archaeon]MDP7646463.1 hypothetical protein [Candidatus Woesearchaeota archaeon]
MRDTNYTNRQQQKLENLWQDQTEAEAFHGGAASQYERACENARSMYRAMDTQTPHVLAEKVKAIGWPPEPPEDSEAARVHAVLRKNEGEKGAALLALDELVRLVDDLHPTA